MGKEHIKYDRKWAVYMHTSPSGKTYVGITSKKDPRDRWGHNGILYKYNTLFWNAIQKYGWDNMKHEILYENLEEMEAKNMEIMLISMYKSADMSYNISDGGDGCSYVMHQSQRDNISKALKGRKKSPEHVQKVIEAISGRDWIWIHKDEMETRIDPKDIGDYPDWEKGRCYSPSEESRVKIGNAARGRIPGDEYRTNMGKIMKGKKKGYININNGTCNKQVPPNKLEEYLSNGWMRGFVSRSRKDSIWMNNGLEDVRVNRSDIDKYLSDGWKKGRRACGYKNEHNKRSRGEQ